MLVHQMDKITWSRTQAVSRDKKSIKSTASLIKWTCWLVRWERSAAQSQERVQRTHRWLAIVCLPDLIQNHVLYENSHSFKYKRHKQMHVDVVSCAVQLSVKETKYMDFFLISLNKFLPIKDLEQALYVIWKSSYKVCARGTRFEYISTRNLTIWIYEGKQQCVF